MRRYISHAEMFRFGIESDEIDRIEVVANAGDAEACYKFGRMLYATRLESDSVQQAEEYFVKAQRGGVVDADVALGLMWRTGEMGMVDIPMSSALILGALKKGSEFAAVVVIYDLIFGGVGRNKNPQHAIEMLNEIIPQTDNPLFLLLMGHAVAESEGLIASREWYKKAVDAGCIDAYSFYAKAMTHNNSGELVDADMYTELLEKGVEVDDYYSQYLLNKHYLERLYPELVAGVERDEFRDSTVGMIDAISELAIADAAALLGDIYQRGLFGIKEDYQRAFSYYSRGAIHNSGICYEMMHDMITEGLVDGYDTDFADQCAINGARFGSANMLIETVEAYKSGRLTEFAAEIEQWYLPVYEATPSFDEEEIDEDDLPDDDGRYDAYA